MLTRLLVLGGVIAFATPCTAQQTDAAAPEPDEPLTASEYVVVTASRVEEELVNAPASVSVIQSDTIQNAPATNIGDLLRTVPGVNVTQLSARDVNVTSRAAASTLATSQLALVDGRTIYLDFFGMVMWDLVSANATEIKQIEVIRGPVSAVWGANAMTGVINVITKTPRELAAERQGTFTIGVGAFDRDVSGREGDPGLFLSVNGGYARAVDARWSYKLSAGYLTQDALPRPAGRIPNAYQTPYPAFPNSGTSQPKFDARVDYEPEKGTLFSISGGLAGTEGVIHTGIGPFDIARGTRLGYVSTRYAKGGRTISVFANLLNGESANVLAAAPDGRPLRLDFVTRTFDVSAADVRTLGGSHLLSYGGNYRRNNFDFSLAPSGEDRDEGGGYIQDEIFFGSHLRWIVGGRVDTFSSINGAVFSPRTSLVVKPAPAHAVRLSVNRAFRAPSYINNNLDTTVSTELNLGLINPALAGVVYTFPVHAVGNTDLEQETMTAYEIGYTGIVRNSRAVATAAVYWNRIDDAIFFTQTARYGAANPPAGWPLPPLILEAAAAAGSPLPAVFSYRNLGTVKDKGVEVGFETPVTDAVDAYSSYSYQWTPETEGLPLSEINLPPHHRFSTGVQLNRRPIIANVSVTYTDEAFWQDVLDQRYHGTTDAYTLVNAAVGVQWGGGRSQATIKITNLANREVRQHIFGDVIKRQAIAELRVAF